MRKKIKIEIKSIWGSVLYESEKPTIKEAIVDANLYGADLYGADLRGADLYGADLRDANLYGADLYGADLRGANLYGANLRDANLRDANLYGADLYGANLRDANLRDANLYGADLYGANLRGANLYGANLRGADLYGANPELLGDYTNQCSRDMLFIFQHLKKELPGLRKALVEGRVDGSQYDGDCACLIGTLGSVDGGVDQVCSMIPFYKKGLNNYGEQWFWQINKGDTPENNKFAKHAVMLIDMVDPPKKRRASKNK